MIAFQKIINPRFSLLIFSCLLAFTAWSQTNDNTYNVLSFGATHDTTIVSTKPIQAAIDSCYRQGGGTVFFPAGNYISGTIILKDNVVLHLEAEATLYASRNIDDYRAPLQDATRPVFIYANGAKNIGVKGQGEINAACVLATVLHIEEALGSLRLNSRIMPMNAIVESSGSAQKRARGG